MTFEDWFAGLTTEQRYNFDSEGRGYKKDCTVMMRLAWDAAVAAERERCAKACDADGMALMDLAHDGHVDGDTAGFGMRVCGHIKRAILDGGCDDA
jgi:hypothetical protein